MVIVPARAPVAPAGPSSETRKWERVSLVGTHAYAVLSTDAEKTARVLDLSYGGVGLQVEDATGTPATFQAVLHVPILPPVKVSLRKVYEQAVDSSQSRIGCAFVS